MAKPDKESVNTAGREVRAEVGMWGRGGLIPFLLVWASLDPALPAPAQPICDQSVMNKFIQDASKMEKDIVDLCEDACNLPEHVTVLDTRVNFPDWPAMDRSRQASEVWRGQALLSVAVGHVKSQQPRMQPFLRQLEVMESGLRSIREILRRHNAQADPQEEPLLRTLSVQTVQKLFSVYSSFLRGKVNLFLASACQASGR
ncbi:erythropoietin [Protobothrops mucrosquamatus]|uniref:erythropoietin n=1 Tax=Protobothrops mucrosquamatus TaxID=103944 RepID=UPI000775F802|nr:erythropoietin [Protobothrops mucrosquamatus]